MHSIERTGTVADLHVVEAVRVLHHVAVAPVRARRIGHGADACINGRQCSCFERFPSVCSEPVLVKPLSFCLFRACLGKHDDHVYIQKSGHKRRCFSYRSPGPPGSSKRSAGSPCHRGVRGCGRRSRGRLRSRSGRRQRRSASSLAPANRTNSSRYKTNAGRKAPEIQDDEEEGRAPRS